MKRIFLNKSLSDIDQSRLKEDSKKFDIKLIKNKTKVNLVLLFGILPIPVLGHAWNIKQKRRYKYVCELFDIESLKQACFGNYNVWVSTNLFSVVTLLTFVIAKIRGGKFGVRVKEWFFKRHNFLGRLSSRLSKPISKRCDFLLAHSKKSEEFIIKKLKIGREKVFYSPKPWDDFSKIKLSKDRLNKISRQHVKKGKKTILYVGRFMHIKGLKNLIYAMKDIKGKVRIIFIGNHKNRYGKECMELSEKLEIDAEFLGQVGKGKRSPEMAYYYRISDLLVLPNKYLPNEYEPLEIWGGVINEALSMGVPVIVTDATGCADDLVKGKDTGMVVKQNSVEDLERALRDFLENPEKWKKFGRNGPKVFKENNENNYKGYVKLFEAIEDGRV